MSERPDVASATTEDRDDVQSDSRQGVVPWRSIWRVIVALLATAALLWALYQVRSLVAMIVIALFFSLALEPAVRWLHRRYGWSRAASVGLIYVGLLVFLVVMVVVLIPAIAELARTIGDQGPGWIESLNEWAQETFGTDVVSDDVAESGTSGIAQYAGDWADDAFGTITGIASAGVGFVFSVATIAMFTFYFTADSPRLARMVLSWFPPERQQRLGWTLDQAVEQTGGYFYSRSILMIICGLG
ncbi:MAG: AI-2E family transporter, partial [Acidimicrobiia bacterium]|nr:AI-2E family transporter [Acidimicrobiia bacterium]